MNVQVKKLYVYGIGTMVRLTLGDKHVQFEPGKPYLFYLALEALGVPIDTFDEKRPSLKENSRYDARAQQHHFVVEAAGVLFTFAIADSQITTNNRALAEVVEEIQRGCYWKDSVEEGA